MIELQNVRLAFDTRSILDGVSFSVPDARVTAILGPSGSGKSTILKLMLGLIKPDSGSILVNGVDIVPLKETELFEIRRTMGMVFQGNALFDSLNVVENMAYFLRENQSLPDSEIEARVRHQIAFAGLEGFEESLPDTLSGGMRKRLAIGRALIFDPSLVLLDEPTVGLDPVNTKKILALINRLKQEQGLGAVFVTHLINDVFETADRVVVLYHGRVIFDEEPALMAESEHPFIASFLSDPESMEGGGRP